MKTILVLLLVCATALAAPSRLTANEILERSMQPGANRIEDVDLDDDGHFSVRFIGEDGTTVQEEGIVVEDQSTGAFGIMVQKGYYFYTSEDGEPVELAYDANNPGQIVI